MLQASIVRASYLLGNRFVTLLPCKRHISFASVINRGIRRTNDKSGQLGSRSQILDRSKEQVSASRPPSRSRLQQQNLKDDGKGSLRRRRRSRNSLPEDVSEEAPIAKPYTTAGSEFLYGTFAVKAALEANRRKFYKLYIWRGQDAAQDEHDESVYTLARARRVPVMFVAGTWDKMLAKMSGQRPHNGYILEASVVPKMSVSALQSLDHPGSELCVSTIQQSAEDQVINDIFSESTLGRLIPRIGTKARYPLVLWLDRITDTGNLGAIMRTAHFIGVDAVVITEHGTAPLNPVTIKASAGAAEMLPILSVKRELDFVQRSQKNGWKFIAAVAPDSASTWSQLSRQGSFVAENALDHSPCVLMLGNEGEGLRAMMQKAADNFVSIRGVRGHADGVESLNVSVAAALLMARLLSKANTAIQKGAAEPSKTDSGSQISATSVF